MSTQWTQAACRYCGNFHTGICPRVKAISYHNDGSVARVEFFDQVTPGLRDALVDALGWGYPGPAA